MEVLFSQTILFVLKIFGCFGYPCIRSYNNHKLQDKYVPCTFIGYNPCYKGFKCLTKDGRLYISMDVHFDEIIIPFDEPLSTSLPKIYTLPHRKFYPLGKSQLILYPLSLSLLIKVHLPYHLLIHS